MRFQSSFNIFPTIFLKNMKTILRLWTTQKQGVGCIWAAMGSSFATSGLDKCEHLVMKKLSRFGLPKTTICFISISLNLDFSLLKFAWTYALGCRSASEFLGDRSVPRGRSSLHAPIFHIVCTPVTVGALEPAADPCVIMVP